LEVTSGDLLQIFMQRYERSGTEKLFTKASLSDTEYDKNDVWAYNFSLNVPTVFFTTVLRLLFLV
jgi:hypothetical protein